MLLRASQKIRAVVQGCYQSALLHQLLLGSVLLWLAFPPVGWSLLAWVAPAVWIRWILPTVWPEERAYLKLWVAGTVFWLLAAHWIRLPHPLNYLAWIVLASYLGIYLPVFIGLSRIAVHRWRIPLWLAAPVVWTGLDLARAYVMTGFLMGSLAHTQVKFPLLVQVADVFGEYGVTFLVVLVAACLALVWSFENSVFSIRKYVSLFPAVIAVGATLLYGTRNYQVPEEASQLGPRLALIQGNTLADWKSDLNKQEQIMREYVGLSHTAIDQSKDRKVELVIWPETAFRQNLVTVESGYTPPADRVHQSRLTAGKRDLAAFVSDIKTPALVGIDRTHIFPNESGELDYTFYNSSVLVDGNGKLLGTYDKMHRVPFGEYIPLAEWFPFLYRLTPLTGGIQAGSSPSALQLDGTTYSVNICYETVVPHLIAQHIRQLDQAQTPADVMVNLTNDAWYWGSSELDMHLACGVFRAVETRKPLVISANGGLSAHINRNGKVMGVTQRQRPEVLLADIRKSGQNHLTLYVVWGDWFAGTCLLCCIVLAIVGFRHRRHSIGVS